VPLEDSGWLKVGNAWHNGMAALLICMSAVIADVIVNFCLCYGSVEQTRPEQSLFDRRMGRSSFSYIISKQAIRKRISKRHRVIIVAEEREAPVALS
jgi:hypothetical protein